MTVIGDRAYLFGGKQDGGDICNTDIHSISIPSRESPESIKYACYPAVATNPMGTGHVPLPSPRYGHAACKRGNTLVIHGGRDKDGPLQDEGSRLWLWDSESTKWNILSPANVKGKAPEPRWNHRVFVDAKRNALILHGGQTKSENTGSSETWKFDFESAEWTQLPPAPAQCLSAAFVNDTLYSVGSNADSKGSLHVLEMENLEKEDAKLEWSSIETPTKAATPGSQPREGSPLIPITTGYGRFYLLQFFGGAYNGGSTADSETPIHSDIWSLQIPSGNKSATKVKDMIRDRLPKMESGVFSWYEVEIGPSNPEQSKETARPGPRSFFGADASSDGKRAILWGGVGATGEVESDGWVLDIV